MSSRSLALATLAIAAALGPLRLSLDSGNIPVSNLAETAFSGSQVFDPQGSDDGLCDCCCQPACISKTILVPCWETI
ncbi:MAG: hypothetical protein AAF456_25400, partial [Planctomycetota bacterium]